MEDTFQGTRLSIHARTSESSGGFILHRVMRQQTQAVARQHTDLGMCVLSIRDFLNFLKASCRVNKDVWSDTCFKKKQG